MLSGRSMPLWAPTQRATSRIWRINSSAEYKAPANNEKSRSSENRYVSK
jgi:hypothetical protein